MDLGLKGRKALVCASSQGLGYACAYALSREGVTVTLNGRDEALRGTRSPPPQATKFTPSSQTLATKRPAQA